VLKQGQNGYQIGQHFMSADDLVVPQDVLDCVPFSSIPERLAAHAMVFPHRTAVKCGAVERTWASFDRRISKIARTIALMGLGRGDKIALLAGNSVEAVESFVGALRSGVCVVPLPPVNQRAIVVQMLTDCDARALFVSKGYLPLVEGHKSGLIGDRMIAYDFERPGWHSFEAWLADADDAPVDVGLQRHDDFNIIYTSGTTGMPKGIVHSHVFRSQLPVDWERFDFSPESITLISTLLHSNITLIALLATLGAGGTAILMEQFNPLEFLRIAERERVTNCMLVPIQYQQVLALPDFGRFDLGYFKCKMSTGGPLPRPTKQDCLKRWPGRLVEIYGLTEGGGRSMLEVGLCPDKLHTAGLPGEKVEFKFIDENDRELPLGSVGEIVGRSHLMMKGYYKRPERTRELFWRDSEGRLFFRSGDIGRLDEDGFLVVLDRKSDVIHSGGVSIYAAEVEAVLLRHAQVAEAAVIGVPDRQAGELPLAVVVLRDGAPLAAEELRSWANDLLGRSWSIVRVEVRNSLPRSGVGKILKHELRDLYAVMTKPGRAT
jgi:long-chain acyl-CoA synthetase